MLTTYTYYLERMECAKPRNETRKACYCPSGYHGWRCSEPTPRKCKIDIVEPNMKAGCPDEKDSDDYVYSIKGYDPCHEVDLAADELKIKYQMTCKDVDENQKVINGGHPEGLGYNYSEVVGIDKSNLKDFEYVVVNPETGLKLREEPDHDFVFDFRDFMYMSHIDRWRDKVLDAEVAAGLKNGTLRVKWDNILASDAKNASKYVVAGRVFWEANLFYPNTTTFVTSGFFAQKGYEEPRLDSISGTDAKGIVLGIIAALIVIVVVVLCYKRHQKRKEEERKERIDHRSPPRRAEASPSRSTERQAEVLRAEERLLQEAAASQMNQQQQESMRKQQFLQAEEQLVQQDMINQMNQQRQDVANRMSQEQHMARDIYGAPHIPGGSASTPTRGPGPLSDQS